jgi:hypothetical protein
MPRVRLAFALFAVAALLTAPFAHGATSSVVVSQIYGGGGNAGATYTNDFVELFNRGATALDLTGWTVSTRRRPRRLAVDAAHGRSAGPLLPSPARVGGVGRLAVAAADATGTANLAPAASRARARCAGRSCGAAGKLRERSLIEDLVGYSSAADYEALVRRHSAARPLLYATPAAAATRTRAERLHRRARSTEQSLSGGLLHGRVVPSVGAAAINVDVQPVLSISLERSSLSFGSVVSGSSPSQLSERVTVMSNNASGYALTVHRSAFTPSDLPLGIAAPAGASLVAIPIAPAPDLQIAVSAAPSAPAGDVWPTSVGFVSALPAVGPGHYTRR